MTDTTCDLTPDELAFFFEIFHTLYNQKKMGEKQNIVFPTAMFSDSKTYIVRLSDNCATIILSIISRNVYIFKLTKIEEAIPQWKFIQTCAEEIQLSDLTGFGQSIAINSDGDTVVISSGSTKNKNGMVYLFSEALMAEEKEEGVSTENGFWGLEDLFHPTGDLINATEFGKIVTIDGNGGKIAFTYELDGITRIRCLEDHALLSWKTIKDFRMKFTVDSIGVLGTTIKEIALSKDGKSLYAAMHANEYKIGDKGSYPNGFVLFHVIFARHGHSPVECITINQFELTPFLGLAFEPINRSIAIESSINGNYISVLFLFENKEKTRKAHSVHYERKKNNEFVIQTTFNFEKVMN